MSIYNYFGKAWMKLSGFTCTSAGPVPSKCVIIAFPHTSNWDFAFTLAIPAVLGFRVHWIGKHTLFRWPFGGIMRALGGVAIDRRANQNLVAALAAEFSKREAFALAVPAEGTRKRVDMWRSGFYHIATTAQVPVVCAFVDYQTKRCGLGHVFTPSGDVAKDMDGVRAFYRGMQGKHPELSSEPRLKEEAPRS